MKLGWVQATTFLCALTILSSLAEAKPASAPAEFSLRMGGRQSASEDSKPTAAFGTTMDYTFYKSYLVGVNASYFRQMGKLQTESAKGYEDVVIYLSDKALWKNRYYGLTLSAKAGFISPVSWASQQASQIYGLSQALTLKKDVSDRFNLSYVVSMTEYSYEYTTVNSDVTGDDDVYNTRWRATNRALVNYDLLRSLHWGTAVWVYTYQNTNNQHTELRGAGTAFTIDLSKMNTVDIGVSSVYKSAGPDVWDSPTYSKEPFHRDGITIYLGTTLKI